MASQKVLSFTCNGQSLHICGWSWVSTRDCHHHHVPPSSSIAPSASVGSGLGRSRGLGSRHRLNRLAVGELNYLWLTSRRAVLNLKSEKKCNLHLYRWNVSFHNCTDLNSHLIIGTLASLVLLSSWNVSLEILRFICLTSTKYYQMWNLLEFRKKILKYGRIWKMKESRV